MSRALVIYALILPLAVFLGYMLATPTDFGSFAAMLLAFSALSLPLVLKWHHFFLAMAWNSVLIVFFLPGQPQLGIVLAFVSLGVSVITRTLSKQRAFISVPSITMPLIMLAIVTIVTAKLTGGIGARVLGAETWGAKRYLGVFGAIVGYFAMTAQRVPIEKANWYVAAFFLGGLTSLISDLVYMAGPQFYFLYVLFPSDYAALQAVTAETLMRLSGVAFACAWGFRFFLARFGIEGVFDLSRPWRLLLLIGFVGGSLLGGYRGVVIILSLVFLCQFIVERVYRQRLGPVLIFAGLLMVGLTIGFVDRMPLAVQRAFSFLPLDRIDPTARMDALGTLDWRLTMWKILVPEIPKYLLLGKGYSFSGTDYFLTQEAVRKGIMSAYEDVLVSGNYHNGVLTLLIPFGIFGFTGFLWFCYAGFKVLHSNFRYGSPALKKINTFLMADYVARLIFYFVFYGQFDLDFLHFTGLVGLSIALNGGLLTAPAPEVEVAEEPELTAIPSRRAVAF